MSAADQEPSPPVATKVPASAAAAGQRRWAVAVAWGAVLLAVAALGWAASLSQQLSQTQQEMARRNAATLAEAAAATNTAAQAQDLAKDMAARLGVVELRLSEVALQRTQLEELMLSVSRSRDDSLVQDIESALRLALQQSQLTGGAQPIISALQGAQQRIERSAQPRLNPVQRAIERDIERLRTAELIDVPALVVRIDELRRQVDEWPLRNAPRAMPVASEQALQTPEVALTPPPTASASAPVEQSQEPVGSLLERLWFRFDAWRSDALARGWDQFRHSTENLIRVSRIDQPEAALLAPEQSFLLRENIKLQLLNVRLGLLGREIDTARSDIAATHLLVQRYFDDNAPATRRALLMLTQLHEDMGQEALPRPDETLGALAVAASGR